MKVEVKMKTGIAAPYAVIYANEMSKEVQDAVAALTDRQKMVSVLENGKILFLKLEEIFMVRVENEQTVVYCEKQTYRSGKRLYQMEEMAGGEFVRISKSAIVNVQHIYGVEAGFKGMMTLVLKNGCKEYISRTYLPAFKKHFGI